MIKYHGQVTLDLWVPVNQAIASATQPQADINTKILKHLAWEYTSTRIRPRYTHSTE